MVLRTDRSKKRIPLTQEEGVLRPRINAWEKHRAWLELEPAHGTIVALKPQEPIQEEADTNSVPPKKDEPKPSAKANRKIREIALFLFKSATRGVTRFARLLGDYDDILDNKR